MQEHDTDSLSEQIAQHIAEQIITGELVEGERIQELRFAEEFDVSRGSIREALLLLERTHLIEIYPRRGAVVSEMSAQQISSLFEISSLLLGQMVQKVTDALQMHESENLKHLLEKLSEECRLSNIENFYDLIFQGLLKHRVKINNSYLIKYYEELLPSLRRSYFLILNTSKTELQESLELFKLVITAMVSRNSQQAAINMENFCRHLRDLVLESLTRMKQIELAWVRRSRR